MSSDNSRAYALSPKKTILVFLWYAGHQTASFRDVADRFDICIKTLHEIIRRVSEFVCSLGKDVIQWPSEAEMAITKSYFMQKKGFPNVIGKYTLQVQLCFNSNKIILGCIDGTHIKIDRPSKDQADYCNRKNYHSIILQGTNISTVGNMQSPKFICSKAYAMSRSNS